MILSCKLVFDRVFEEQLEVEILPDCSPLYAVCTANEQVVVYLIVRVQSRDECEWWSCEEFTRCDALAGTCPWRTHTPSIFRHASPLPQQSRREMGLRQEAGHMRPCQATLELRTWHSRWRRQADRQSRTPSTSPHRTLSTTPDCLAKASSGQCVLSLSKSTPFIGQKTTISSTLPWSVMVRPSMLARKRKLKLVHAFMTPPADPDTNQSNQSHRG